jgi:hypothetical protein
MWRFDTIRCSTRGEYFRIAGLPRLSVRSNLR